MDLAQLVELGRYFDEYMYGDRKQTGVQQAVYVFKATARELYVAEPDQLRENTPLRDISLKSLYQK